jgi:hypothetical protein
VKEQNSVPEHGISQLKVLAIQLHEMFEALKSAGFSRREALTLIGNVMAFGFTQMPDDEKDK